MTKLRAGGFQMYSNGDNIDENAKRVLKGLGTASDAGVSILAFPECALTPFFPIENSSDFERYFLRPDSEVVREISEESRRLDIATILPIAELGEDANLYNSALFLDGGKVVRTYRKAHLPAPFIDGELRNFEKAYFTPGNSGFPVTTMKGVKVGVQICYDRNFPEGYRALALNGAELVFNVTAGGGFGKAWRSETWELLLRARAYENNMFVFGVNKHGPEYEQFYFGHSMAVSPMGAEVIAQAKNDDSDELVVADIDTVSISDAHKRMGWRRDLRRDLCRKVYEGL